MWPNMSRGTNQSLRNTPQNYVGVLFWSIHRNEMICTISLFTCLYEDDEACELKAMEREVD